MTIVVAKWRTPYSTRFKLSTHAAQVAMMLSLTADVYDFLTYAWKVTFIDLVGVDIIYGKNFNFLY
jgi:glutathione synthase/RimK-type ligase-like ATP-grasp enzyme